MKPAMSQPVVLISHRTLEFMAPRLLGKGWGVARAWDLAAAQRPQVRAIVHSGAMDLTAEFLSSLPGLGLIANVGVGYDGIDLAWCRERGVAVTHAKALNADDVADHTLGLLLASWRNIVIGDAVMRSGGWRDDPRMRPARGLKGRKLGIVGLGAIGQAVAVRAEAFGLDVAWWGPRAKPAAWPLADTLLALAEASDILVVACRPDADNEGLIGAEVIDAVGPRGLIINVSRGSLIDEAALVAALTESRLGRAALDVFAQEPPEAGQWANVPNVLLSPHIAGGTSDAMSRMVAQAMDNLDRFLLGDPLASPV